MEIPWKISPTWPVLVAVTAPTAVSAAVNAAGTSIAVTLSEPVTLTNSVNGSEFTLSGTSARVTTIANAGITLTLTVSPAIQPGARVTLAYTARSGDIIADVNENAMSDFTNLLVLTSTTVVVEVTAANRAYKSGDSVPITVTFSAVVIVTGTPQLALNTGTAAPYTGGSGTASLTFTYTVRAGDNTGDLAYTGSGALSGGSIRGATSVNFAYTSSGALSDGSIQGTTPVNLTLPAPGDANSLSGSSNVVLDTTAPAAPTFDAVGDLEGAPTGRSNRLNAADLTDKLQSSDGVPWGGSVEAGATVTLCLAGAGDGTGASCGTGRALRTATTVGTRWSYTLTLIDLAAMGEGAETVTAVATDAAGNVSGEGSYDLIIDTVAPVFISGNSGDVAINSATTVIAYDANARDNGGVADTDIAYTLGATISPTYTFGEIITHPTKKTAATHPVLAYTADELATLTFIANELAIDSATGEVTYINMQSAEVDQTTSSSPRPTWPAIPPRKRSPSRCLMEPESRSPLPMMSPPRPTLPPAMSPSPSRSARMSPDFDADATSQWTAATKGTFTGADGDRIYTLVLTPTPNTVGTNDGTLTVDRGRMATGATTSAVNAETIATQAYDTQAPAAPGIDATIATDNIINIAERDAGVPVSGTTEAEVGITLCAGATDVTDPTCDGGTTFLVRLPDASSNTAWSYTLTADDISAIGNRAVMLTAIAADAAGNTAVSTASASITVNIIAPTSLAIHDPVAGDNFINRKEREAGITVTGTKEIGTSVTLHFDGGAATTYNVIDDTDGNVATSWSYTLTPDQIDTLITVNRFGRGPKSDLTNDLARGTGTLTATDDNGGNTAGLVITVDTIPPVASPSITDVIETVGGTSLVLSGAINNRRYLYRFEVVNVYDGDNLLGQAEVADNFRNWSFTDTTLAAGNLIYTAVVADAAGNEGVPSNAFTVNIADNNDNAFTTRLNEQILTRASQAMIASTLEAVARRVEAVADGTASRAGGAGWYHIAGSGLSIRRPVIVEWAVEITWQGNAGRQYGVRATVRWRLLRRAIICC